MRILAALAITCVAPLAAAQQAELAAFESLVQRCKAAYTARGLEEVAFADLAKSWVKRVYSPATISYDVRKTDSLVAPLAAHIEIDEFVAAERGPNEEGARALAVSIDGPGSRRVTRINFTLQQGQWTATGATLRVARRLKTGAPFERPEGVIEDPMSLRQTKAPIAQCL